MPCTLRGCCCLSDQSIGAQLVSYPTTVPGSDVQGPFTLPSSGGEASVCHLDAHNTQAAQTAMHNLQQPATHPGCCARPQSAPRPATPAALLGGPPSPPGDLCSGVPELACCSQCSYQRHTAAGRDLQRCKSYVAVPVAFTTQQQHKQAGGAGGGPATTQTGQPAA